MAYSCSSVRGNAPSKSLPLSSTRLVLKSISADTSGSRRTRAAAVEFSSNCPNTAAVRSASTRTFIWSVVGSVKFSGVTVLPTTAGLSVVSVQAVNTIAVTVANNMLTINCSFFIVILV